MTHSSKAGKWSRVVPKEKDTELGDSGTIVVGADLQVAPGNSV